MLAISGLHVGIVAFTVYAVVRFLIGFVPALLWAGWGEKSAVLATLPVVFLYGFLAGMSPSTQRAVIMVTFFLLAAWAGRDQDIINTAAAAALIILMLHPPALFSISFQLSFAAVLSIIIGMSRISGLLLSSGTIPATLVNKGLTMAMVTLFATAGTAPLVMAYFNQVSLIGLAVNLIMVPLVGFFVVPVGLLSICMYFVSTSAAAACLKLCGIVLSTALRVVFRFSDFSFAAVKTITPSILEIGLVYLLLWGLINGGAAVKGRSADSVFGKRWAGIMVLVAVIGLSVDTLYWLQVRYWHTDLRITVLDVGQGSAALLELPKGHILLLDGGGFSDNRIFDVGAIIVAPFLWRKKIGTVDTIMLSHANSDHYNGLVYIADHFHVGQVITNGESAETESFRHFEGLLAAKAIARPDFQRLPRKIFVNGVRIDVLHPEKDFLQKSLVKAGDDLNNNSLVVKVVYGRHVFLFPGDIMEAGENRLVDTRGTHLKSDVLIAPHHGSASSSSQRFLEQVDPETVIISAGWRNRFNFPNKTVLERYAALGCRVYRTDLNGAVQIRTDGAEMEIRTVLPVVPFSHQATSGASGGSGADESETDPIQYGQLVKSISLSSQPIGRYTHEESPEAPVTAGLDEIDLLIEQVRQLRNEHNPQWEIMYQTLFSRLEVIYNQKPTSPEVFFYYARACEAGGDIRKANKYIEKAVYYDPQYTQAFEFRADMNYHYGKTTPKARAKRKLAALAQQDYEAAARVSTDPAFQAMMYYKIGKVYSDLTGDSAMADQFMQKAVSTAPGSEAARLAQSR
ncbi:MAG: DNA internalization-related competence protein ComEC/Rec2 [Deltaproteobacteria bacterium]